SLVMLAAFESAGLAVAARLNEKDYLLDPAGRCTFLGTGGVRTMGATDASAAGVAHWAGLAAFLLRPWWAAEGFDESVPGWASFPLRLRPDDSFDGREREEFVWLADRLWRATSAPPR